VGIYYVSLDNNPNPIPNPIVNPNPKPTSVTTADGTLFTSGHAKSFL